MASDFSKKTGHGDYTGPCYCERLGVLMLGAEDWAIMMVCQRTAHADSAGDVPQRDIVMRDQCGGTNPVCRGSTDYMRQTIYLCGGLHVSAWEACLRHEVGHVITMLTGGDANSEEQANLMACILDKLDIAETESWGELKAEAIKWWQAEADNAEARRLKSLTFQGGTRSGMRDLWRDAPAPSDDPRKADVAGFDKAVTLETVRAYLDEWNKVKFMFPNGLPDEERMRKIRDHSLNGK